MITKPGMAQTRASLPNQSGGFAPNKPVIGASILLRIPLSLLITCSASIDIATKPTTLGTK